MAVTFALGDLRQLQRQPGDHVEIHHARHRTAPNRPPVPSHPEEADAADPH
jgi:hypothetical protein